jgi:hypothetical protein
MFQIYGTETFIVPVEFSSNAGGLMLNAGGLMMSTIDSNINVSSC